MSTRADVTTENLLAPVPRPIAIFFSWALVFWIAAIVLGLTVFTKQAETITRENGVLATLTVLGYVGAGATMLRLALPAACGGGPRRWWLLLLGAGFLFIAAEETSWGQTYLRYQTPEAIRRVNIQREFNVHNLPLPFAPAARWANHASWLVALLGGIALPLVLRYSPRLRRRLWEWQVPLPPRLSQAWFCVGALVPRDVFLLGMLPRDNIPSEMREFSLTVAVAIWACCAWQEHRTLRSNLLDRGGDTRAS